MKVLVASASGLIKGHLVSRLLSDGHNVKAIDIKPLQNRYAHHENAETYDRTENETEIAKNKQP